jgi:Xanthosine triphosphate pyrophosphatase
VRDLGAHPEVSEIRESGTSFEENAKLKALAASRHLPALVIADDSGLEVDALGGAPGIYSARYAARTRRTGTKSINYFASSHEFAPQMMASRSISLRRSAGA